MAKQPKVAAPPAAPAQPAAPAPAAKTTKASGFPAKSNSDGDVFIRVLGADGKGLIPVADTPPVAKKLAPQAQLIANVIEASGPKGITRKELTDKLVPAGLVTRQPAGRILSYYQKPMVDDGWITMTKAVPAAPAPAAAPAPTAAPAAA
jgi:pyruvate/2-oxoglutarate dehydrogenase complex dihydrolipoamide acyltransferase (E2) component